MSYKCDCYHCTWNIGCDTDRANRALCGVAEHLGKGPPYSSEYLDRAARLIRRVADDRGIVLTESIRSLALSGYQLPLDPERK